MFKDILTEKQKSLLQHTLGADERYMKKDWGFRNYFNNDNENNPDHEVLQSLVENGCMVQQGQNYFATKVGAISIGFKQYQLAGKKFPKSWIDKIKIEEARNITGYEKQSFDEYDGCKCDYCNSIMTKSNSGNELKTSYEYDEYNFACSKCVLAMAKSVSAYPNAVVFGLS